jgi:hypothetical protein
MSVTVKVLIGWLLFGRFFGARGKHNLPAFGLAWFGDGGIAILGSKIRATATIKQRYIGKV